MKVDKFDKSQFGWYEYSVACLSLSIFYLLKESK